MDTPEKIAKNFQNADAYPMLIAWDSWNIFLKSYQYSHKNEIPATYETGLNQLDMSNRPHNPEVAGSSPVPATRESTVFRRKYGVFLTFHWSLNIRKKDRSIKCLSTLILASQQVSQLFSVSLSHCGVTVLLRLNIGVGGKLVVGVSQPRLDIFHVVVEGV